MQAMVRPSDWAITQVYAQGPQIYLWLPVAFGSGIATYFSQLGEPKVVTLHLFAFVACFGFLLVGLWRSNAAGLILLPSVLVAGFVWAGYRAHWVAEPVIQFRYYGAVQGRVVGIDLSAAGKPRLLLDQIVLDRVGYVRTPARVRVAIHGDDALRKFQIGQTVLTTAHLSPPPSPAEPGGFDFQRHAWFLKLGAVGYTRSPVMLWDDTVNTQALWLSRHRRKISNYIATYLPADTAGVAVAITTGERSHLQEKVVDSLRKANLAHLLAISGLHMGLLTSLIFAGLRSGLVLIPGFGLTRHVKQAAAIGAMLAGGIYLALSGASVATERAFLMACVIFGAVLFSRRAITLRAVCLAAMIVLVLRPEVLISPGFQMSFSATLALVLVFEALRNTNLGKLPGLVRYSVFAVISAAVAGAATAPFAAAHFNMLPHYGILANFFAIPAMAFVVMPGAILAVLLAPFGLAWIGLWIMDVGLKAILWIANHISEFSGSYSLIVAPDPLVLPILVAGLLVLAFITGPIRWVAMGPIFFALYIWSETQRPDILIASDGQIVGHMTNQGRALSRAKGAGFSARVWLENDADGADQFQASQRRLPSQAQVIWVRDINKLAECPAPITVSAKKLAPETNLHCEVLDEKALRTSGARAAYLKTDGTLKWVTVRDRSGQRLWNSRRK